MKIEEAIACYLDARKAQGLRLSAVETLGRALRKVFESVLTEHIKILTADQVNELRARLGRRGVLQGEPMLGRIRNLFLRLLLHPSMARLPEHAKEAGLDLGLGNNGFGKP